MQVLTWIKTNKCIDPKTMVLAQLCEIETWTRLNCQPYNVNFWTKFLAFTRYTSLLITIALYAYGIARRELYSVYFGFVLTLDGLFSLAVHYIVRNPVPIATCPSVYGPYGFPAGEVEHTTLFVTFILLYCFVWRSRTIRAWHLALLLFYQATLVYAFNFLNYNTPAQILAGAVIGSFNAFLAQVVFYVFIFPYWKCVLGWRAVEFMGYQDTLCLPENEAVRR